MTLAKAFDRPIINVRERPLSGDINQMMSNLDYTQREFIQRLFGYRSLTTPNSGSNLPQGFISDGFKADPGAGMQVILRAGEGMMDGTGDQPTNINAANNLNDQHPLKPLVLSAPEAITVPAADPANPRWDIIEAKYDRQVLNPTSRDILNTGTGIFTPGIVDKDLVFDLAGLSTVNGAGPINYKTGAPAGVPVVPATDAGYMRIGRVWVPAAAASIVADDIIDDRRLLIPGGGVRIAGVALVNHTTYAFTSAMITCCPPGVDVAMFTYLGTTAFGVQVIGPFPGLAGAAGLQATVEFNVFPNVIAASPGAAMSLLGGANNYKTGSFAWLDGRGAPTAIFPAVALTGNANVLHNSVYAQCTPFEFVTPNYVNPTSDFIVAWSIHIPIV